MRPMFEMRAMFGMVVCVMCNVRKFLCVRRLLLRVKKRKLEESTQIVGSSSVLAAVYDHEADGNSDRHRKHTHAHTGTHIHTHTYTHTHAHTHTHTHTHTVHSGHLNRKIGR